MFLLGGRLSCKGDRVIGEGEKKVKCRIEKR